MARSAALRGIEERHQTSCRSRDGRRCGCSPSYRAKVYDKTNRVYRKSRWLSNLVDARAWRVEAERAVRLGSFSTTSHTVREAAQRFFKGMKDGSVRNRSGRPFKASAIRSYETSFRLHLDRELGAVPLDELQRSELQRLVDDLSLRHDASTVRNTLLPLRAIYRQALSRSLVKDNPTRDLMLPAVTGKRNRIASPAEATRLIEALRYDKALWTTLLYAGLRMGEAQALHIQDADLAAGVIRVERSWDKHEGIIEPKSDAGTRSVPIATVLRGPLAAHLLALDWSEGLIFGRSPDRPFQPTSVVNRADEAWRKAGLERITPHQCRHTFASLMIAAGVNAKALSTFLGHSSIQVTLDTYGHLMPGSEAEAATLLDSYLERVAEDSPIR